MDLLSLPVVMIEHIFSYLTYDEIAKLRLVCKDIDIICQRMLNRGFLMMERRHVASLKAVRAQLPRRESERRYHPLARHCDILTSIETRISMLNMTYSKFIDNNLCCFIPGKVIDEIQRVLDIVETCTQPLRAHEVLQELRDISSMAIEHFDDKVSPAFRKRLQEGAVKAMTTGGTSLVQASKSNSNCANQLMMINPTMWRNEFFALRRKAAYNCKLMTHLTCKYNKLSKKLHSYKMLALRQGKIIKELSSKQADQDAMMADMKKRMEECDIKYSELTHTNQAVSVKAGKSSDAESAQQPLRHFASQIKLDLSVLPIGTGKLKPVSSNIKPRKTLMKMPSLTEAGEVSSPKKPRLVPDEQTGKQKHADKLSSVYSRLGKRSFSESSSLEGARTDFINKKFKID